MTLGTSFSFFYKALTPNTSAMKEALFYYPVSLFREDGFTGKVISSMLMANILLPVWAFINEYVFSDWDYLLFLGVILTVDAFLGMVKHYKFKTFSWEEFISKFGYNKAIPIGSMLILFHVLENGIAMDSATLGAEYISYMKHAMMILYVSGSAVINIYYITDHKFPPRSFMEKIGVKEADLKAADPENKKDA